MRFSLLLLFVSVWITAGCRDGEAPKNSSGENARPERGVLTGDFYRRLTGTIAGKRVTMHLHRIGDWTGGSYSYDAVGIPISLVGWTDSTPRDAVLVLEEYDETGPLDTTYRYPLMRLTLSADGATGTWTSGDSTKTFDVALREDYPEGSTPLTVHSFEDSARLVASRPRPVATARYATLSPPDAEDRWIADALYSEFSEAHAAGEKGGWDKIFRRAAQDFFAEYRGGEEGLDTTDPEVLESEMNNYSDERRVSVMMNERDWLVLRSHWYGYTGGAHGNHGSGFLVLDKAAKQSLRLTDVVADTAVLAPFLDAAVRTRFGVAPEEPLTEYLFVDVPPVTENFYITPTGLGFVYSPYEIAAYAAGEVHLFLPYKRIGMLLTEDFKRRMGLANGAVMRG